MMSFIKSVILAVIAVITSATNESDLKWYCNTYCADSGGVPLFDRETLKCTCLLSKTVDTADIALVQKNAKAVDLAFEIVDPSDTAERPVFKRAISETVGQRAPQAHRRRPSINRGQSHSQSHHLSPTRPRHGLRNRQSQQHSQTSLHNQQQHHQHDVHHQQQQHDLHHQQQQHHQQLHHQQQQHHRPSLRQRMRHRNIVGSTQEKEPSDVSSTETPKTSTTQKIGDQETKSDVQIITQPTELM